MPATYRKWIITKPMTADVLSVDQFALRELPLPDVGPGQALVRVKLVNIHSATRSRIASGMTRLGDTDRSNYACAEVIRSRDRTFREGDIIACQAGWQDYQLISSEDTPVGYAPPSDAVKALNGTNSQWNYVFRPAMANRWPPEVLMDVFGTSGMTAWFGMRECGPLTPDDAVAVAGATGSVGSLVAQLARIAGCYVVGFGGGAERCEWVVREFGIDRCLDYRASDFAAQLALAFPSGVDVFSDGIGGSLTGTVAALMNEGGRLFSYGGAAAFYAPTLGVVQPMHSLRRAFGVSEEIEQIIAARKLKCSAWIVDAFYHERIEAEDRLSALLQSGALKPVSHVVDGFEKLPEAVVNLYRTGHSGKLQVRFE